MKDNQVVELELAWQSATSVVSISLAAAIMHLISCVLVIIPDSRVHQSLQLQQLMPALHEFWCGQANA